VLRKKNRSGCSRSSKLPGFAECARFALRPATPPSAGGSSVTFRNWEFFSDPQGRDLGWCSPGEIYLAFREIPSAP
jgi:hypothetical protein